MAGLFSDAKALAELDKWQFQLVGTLRCGVPALKVRKKNARQTRAGRRSAPTLPMKNPCARILVQVTRSAQAV
jgi:hypothetical protein